MATESDRVLTNGQRLDRATPEILVFSLFAATLAWSLILAAVWRVPPRFGQDPYGYFDLATSISAGKGFTYGALADMAGRPIVPTFGPGYPSLLGALFWLFGPNEALARTLTAVVAASCPPLLFATLRALFGDEDVSSSRTAFLGATCLALCGLLVRSSLTLMSDSLALALLLLTVRVGIAFSRRPTSVLGALLGLLASGAIATRYGAFPDAALAVGASLYFSWRNHGRRGVGGALALGGSVAFGGTLLLRVLPEGALLSHPVGSAWSLAHAFATHASGPDGLLSWGGLPLALAYALDLLRPGVGIFGLVVAATIGAVRGRRKIVALALAWIGASTLLVVGLPEHNPRFWLPALPAVSALAAIGVISLRLAVLRQSAVAALVVAGLIGTAREARRMGMQAGTERAWIDVVHALREPGRPLRAFALGVSVALRSREADAEVWEGNASTDADWDAALAEPSRQCLVILPEDAVKQWRGMAFDRIQRALTRPSLRRLEAGGVLIAEVRCGTEGSGR